PGGIGSRGFTGTFYDPECALGNRVPAGFWRRYDCRHDGHHHDHCFQFSPRSRPAKFLPQGGLGFGIVESGLRPRGGVSDLHFQWIARRSSALDTQIERPASNPRRLPERWLYTGWACRLYSPLMTDGAIYCNRCGTQNSALAKFCANCGAPFQSEASVPPRTPEIVPSAQEPLAQPPTVQFTASVPYAPPPLPFTAFWFPLVPSA